MKTPGGHSILWDAPCATKKSQFFKSALTQWPLVYALPPIDPLSSVTQRPSISDLSPKDPNFWFCHPKPHHFNYLVQTLISHNNWSQDFKGFIACDQLDVLYFINLWFEATALSLKDSIIFDLSPKDALFFFFFFFFFLVAPVTERPYVTLKCLVTRYICQIYLIGTYLGQKWG